MYKSGLVLEGGGCRAIYTSGVLDAFMDAGIEFPYIIGVSAGSCNGVSFIGKNYNRMKNITLNHVNDKRYMSVHSMFKNGEFLNSKWIFGELAYDIHPLNHDNYENSDTVMCVACTNALTGKAEYFYPDSLRNECEVLKASCAMPIVSKPVRLGKSVYYDGGLVDSIPLKKAFDDGCEKAVVVLTQDREYRKKSMSHDKMVKRVLKNFPLVADDLLVRHKMYNSQREYVFEQEKKGNILVICPEKVLNCPTLEKNTEKLLDIYNMGYRQGKENSERIKDFLR